MVEVGDPAPRWPKVSARRRAVRGASRGTGAGWGRSGGISRVELVERPPAGGPELSGIELDGPAGVGVTHVPEADIEVPCVETTGHALRHEQRLAGQATEQWRREADLFPALAGHGRCRVLAGLHVPAGGQPQLGQPVVHEEAAAAAASTNRKYATRCLGGVAGFAVRQIGAPL
jgi:hypothetical protein